MRGFPELPTSTSFSLEISWSNKLLLARTPNMEVVWDHGPQGSCRCHRTRISPSLYSALSLCSHPWVRYTTDRIAVRFDHYGFLESKSLLCTHSGPHYRHYCESDPDRLVQRERIQSWNYDHSLEWYREALAYPRTYSARMGFARPSVHGNELERHYVFVCRN